jgi:hypothetical protein
MPRAPYVSKLYSAQLGQLQWLLRIATKDDRISEESNKRVASCVHELMTILMEAQMKPLKQQSA